MTRRWQAAAVALTAVLAAAACTTGRGGSRPPATTSQPRPAPAATANGSPATPARNLRGLIAYSTEAGDIWVMHADGSNRRQLTRTRDPAFDFDPSLSPDGRRVVFRTSRGRYAPDPNGTGSRASSSSTSTAPTSARSSLPGAACSPTGLPTAGGSP